MLFQVIFPLSGRWASPGGIAIPGQPVVEVWQATTLNLTAKIRLISLGTVVPVSDIKLIRTDTTL